MAKFKTTAALQGGYYGKFYYNANKQQYEFEPLGKQVTVDEIVDNIETQNTSLQLSFMYEDGSRKCVTLPNKGLGDGSIIVELAAVGADVTKKNADVFIDSIRIQKEDIELSGQGIRREYDHLGWINRPVVDDTGKTIGHNYCYRASHLIGHITATYTGDYAVNPMGSWEKWRQMVLDEVLGHPLLEVLLVGGLSAVVNGLISPDTTGENSLIHIFAPSSTGKSTLGKLICSTAGQAFTGQRTITCRDGTRKSKKSLFRSWAGTETILIGGCSGNRGAVMVFNELGKLPNSVNLATILYNLSEAGDKERGNEQYKVAQTEAYYCTIFSIGEFSILDKIDTKDEGLRNRVMEITAEKFTDDAEHSRRINNVCNANNGYAAPILAKHILDSGGLPYVLNIYKKYLQTLPAKMPDTPAKDRFVEKFVALFLTTAEIARVALDIPFDLDSIFEWFYAYEVENGAQRNTSRDSYHDVVEACHVHKANFYYDENTPRIEAWGAIKSFPYKPIVGKLLVEEILIRRKPLANILRECKYKSLSNCLREWEKAGYLSRDKDKPTRSRIIEPKGKLEDVYVLRVFGTPPTTNAPLISQPKTPLKSKLATSSQMSNLLAIDEEEDNG